MTTLKLEVGKSYRTRDGRKVTITGKDINSYDALHSDGKTMHHYEDGECPGVYNRDLISEWQDEPEVKEPASHPAAGLEFEGLPKGITLRQWYAGIVAPELLRQLHQNMAFSPEDVANRAFQVADSMLKEGEK